jgi:hypothetical protein
MCAVRRKQFLQTNNIFKVKFQVESEEIVERKVVFHITLHKATK